MENGVESIPLPGDTGDKQRGRRHELAAPFALRSFLVGPENRLLPVALRSVLESEPSGYRPLVLVGPSGTGKSHLAHALALRWKKQPGGRVVHSNASDWARELARAINSDTMADFRNRYRGADLLVLEDLHRLSPKRTVQRELLLTLDALDQTGATCVITSRGALHEIRGLLAGLQSRLTAGLVVTLSLPGEQTRAALARELAGARRVPLSPEAASLLAKGIRGGAVELNRAVGHLGADGQIVDASAVREYLAEHSRSSMPALPAIVAATARHFSLPTSQLKSSSRNRSVVSARAVAMYLARQLTDHSLEKIGRALGGRDHTTVLYNCRKIARRLGTDSQTRQAVADLQRRLTTAESAA